MDLTSINKLQCPQCGHSRTIRVELMTRATLQEMAIYSHEHPTVAMHNEAECRSCHHVGTIEEFYEAATQAPASASVIGDALRRL